MNRASKYLLFGVLFLGFEKKLDAQLSGYNISEFQVGNLPNTEPSDLSTLYDQLKVSYQKNGIRAGIRFETFLGTDSNRLQYQDLSRYYVQYEKDKLEIGVGNFFESLGRGLLLRSFDISGAVLEDRLYRMRYGFYRDVRGFYAKYKGESFQLNYCVASHFLIFYHQTLKADVRILLKVLNRTTGLKTKC